MYIFPHHVAGFQLILFVIFLTAVYGGLMAFFILGALRLARTRYPAGNPANTGRAGDFDAAPSPSRAAASMARSESFPSPASPGRGRSNAPESGLADPELDDNEDGEYPYLPCVSVIVPMRNEEEHAPATLLALSKQDYAGEWEVICVNDRSSDGTESIIRGFCARDARFAIVNVPVEAPSIPSPKKRALAAGFAAAKGEILMTTDADCLAETGWLRSMAMSFAADTGIVQGPKRIRGTGTLLSRYQEHEVFGLVSVEAATFAMGRPMIASAPSLAYRKSLYESVGGFAGIEDSVSGDDDLLVRKMQKVPRWKVAYNPSPEACVTTSPADTWAGMLQQRARWASNGAHYEEKGFVALLCCIYAFYWWLALGPFFAAAGLVPWTLYAATVAVKILSNAVFLGLTSRSLGHRGLLRDLLWCEILHVPIVLAAVILGHLGLYRWK
jgi:cellulose synthase/poly-beta-1,6-N-acetylglucosamine synthase-like glycosyltransferase